MNQTKLSTQQLSFLVIMLLLGSALVYIPEISAGRDAWIASLLASLPGCYVLYAIISIQNIYPGQNIIRICELSLGRIAGTILNLLLLLVLFQLLIKYLYDLGIFLAIVYTQMPLFYLNFIVVLLAAYCLYKGITSLGRLASLFIWFTLIFTILGFLISIPLMKPSHLAPILSNWKPVIAGSLYGADWPFTQVIIVALLLSYINDFKEKQNGIYKWYFLGAVLLALKNAHIFSVLGTEKAELIRFPLYEVYRFASFGNFQRVELFFFILWFLIAFTVIVICFQSLLIGLKEVFRLQDYQSIILPLGLSLVVLTLYMYPTDLEYLNTGVKYLPFLTFPIQILYPTIVLIAAKIKHPA